MKFDDCLRWLGTAFLTLFFLPFFLFVLFTSKLFGYVFGSIFMLIASGASTLNKNLTQPSSYLSGNCIEQSKGQGGEWLATYLLPAIIVISFSFFALDFLQKTEQKTQNGYYQVKTLNRSNSLPKTLKTTIQSNPGKPELKSFALATRMPLNQAISKRFSKFDYQIVQDNLKSAGLYLGPVNGVWGKSSQSALADLKGLLLAQGQVRGLDEISLFAKILRASEEALLKSVAVEAVSAKPDNAIFATEHDKKMFWANTKLNNEECALTWAAGKLVGKQLFEAYWANYKPIPTSIDSKSCDAGIEKVSGYFRANGTYVQPYYRTKANRSGSDNWITKGNVNPFTRKKGYKNW